MYTHLVGKLIANTQQGVEVAYIDIPQALMRSIVTSRDSLVHVLAADPDDFTGVPYTVSQEHPQQELLAKIAHMIWLMNSKGIASANEIVEGFFEIPAEQQTLAAIYEKLKERF